MAALLLRDLERVRRQGDRLLLGIPLLVAGVLLAALAPPVVDVVIDFDGGGRYGCQLADADPAAVAIGDRVEMTFRRFHTAGGVHNYFWKARPVREEH